jgi:hypothetical protein
MSASSHARHLCSITTPIRRLPLPRRRSSPTLVGRVFPYPIVSISAWLLAFARGPFQPEGKGGIPQEEAMENHLFSSPFFR